VPECGRLGGGFFETLLSEWENDYVNSEKHQQHKGTFWVIDQHINQ